MWTFIVVRILIITGSQKCEVERTLEVCNPTAMLKVTIIYVCIIPERAPEDSS